MIKHLSILAATALMSVGIHAQEIRESVFEKNPNCILCVHMDELNANEQQALSVSKQYNAAILGVFIEKDSQQFLANKENRDIFISNIRKMGLGLSNQFKGKPAKGAILQEVVYVNFKKNQTSMIALPPEFLKNPQCKVINNEEVCSIVATRINSMEGTITAKDLEGLGKSPVAIPIPIFFNSGKLPAEYSAKIYYSIN